MVANFLTSIKNDPRYSDSLMALMVESNHSSESTTTFWDIAQNKVRPKYLWVVSRPDDRKGPRYGLITTKSTKERMIKFGYELLDKNKLFFARDLVGANEDDLPSKQLEQIEKAKDALQQQMRKLYVEPKQSAVNNTIHLHVSGKDYGPDDLVTALLIGIVFRHENKYSPDLSRFNNRVLQFQPNYESEVASLQF